MLPCEIPISWIKLSDMVVPIRILNSRSLMIVSTKTGTCPRNPDSCMSFTKHYVSTWCHMIFQDQRELTLSGPY